MSVPLHRWPLPARHSRVDLGLTIDSSHSRAVMAVANHGRAKAFAVLVGDKAIFPETEGQYAQAISLARQETTGDKAQAQVIGTTYEPVP